MSLAFSKLADVYEQLEAISSGNAMRKILSDFFKKVPKQDMDKVAYLTLGKIGPEFKEIDLGIAEKMVIRSIAIASGKHVDEVKKEFKRLGDLGKVSAKLVKKSKVSKDLKKYFSAEKLTIENVFNGLWDIAKASGTGSQEIKIKILAVMLLAASPKEAMYITRISLGTLRLGAGAMTILDSLSIALTGSKEKRKEIEHIYNVSSDIGLAAKKAAGVKAFDVVIGNPIRMMLAQRVKKISMIKEKIPGLITAEEKYDGERMQIHKKGNDIMAFSRRLENITKQYPDVIEAVKKAVKAKECIIEGEVVAIKGDRLLPFQVLMQRRRKYNIAEYVEKVPVSLFLFDLLYCNGKSFLKEPYPNRRKQLEKIVKENKIIRLARQITSDKLDDVEDFFKKCLDKGAEGIMAKSNAKDSVYRAGARAWLWIKWKKEYMKGVKDSFDVVVVGAYAGRGKRSGTYGALLCAVYDDKKDEFQTITKVGTGFTDKLLSEFHKKFKKIDKKPTNVKVNKLMEPDYYLKPEIVIEILGAEITKSPAHTCDYKNGKGYAIRFPRFIRYRPEKSAKQATTVKEILGMKK